MNIKVSLLIPAYNSELFILRCLNSCEKQTYKNIEIIVVDDGSTDNTLNIVKDNFYKNKKFKIFSKENEGISKTRNFLLNKMTGEYGFFVDSDDWLEGDCIETFVKNLKSEDLIINSAYVNNHSREKEFYITKDINKNTTVFEYIRNNTFFPWNILFKKEFILNNNILFSEISSFFEDAGIMTLWFLKAKKIKFIRNPKYHYNISNQSSLSHEKKMNFQKINNSLLQLANLYVELKIFYRGINPRKEVLEQLSFYHCVVFSYIQFQSSIDNVQKKVLKSKLKSLEKENWKLPFPKKYWKFWYFILYKFFLY